MSFFRQSLLSLVVVCVAAAAASAQEPLRWETDLGRAQQTAAQTNRLVLIHFWGSWCGPCLQMEREVFSKPGLGTALSPYYVPVRIQVEKGMNEELAQRFAVDAFPSDIVMTSQGQIVHRSKGFQAAEQYVAMLQQAAQAALAQARPVSSGTVAAPTAPLAPTPPPAAPSATSAASTPSAAPNADDRYSYYYQGRNAAPAVAAPAVAASSQPTAPSPAMPMANPVPAAPANNQPAASVGDRYADYRAKPAVSPPLAATVAPVAAPPAAAATTNVGTPPAANATAAIPTPTPASAPTMSKPPVPPSDAPIASPPAVAAVPATPTPTPAAPAATNVAASPAPASAAASPQPAVAQAPATAPAGIQLPPGCPPLALDGYCPVSVTDKMVWKRGDVRYGAVHRGRTYLFPSDAEQKQFLGDPDRYSPVISGNDPVLALEKGETVSGKREFGLMCQNRMFLFANKESYDKFCRDSKRYAGEIFQAMQADDLKRR